MENTYHVSMSAVYYDGAHQMKLERGLDIIYLSENDKTAVVGGIKWALGRKREFPERFGNIACIKVNRYYIGSVDKETGHCNTGIVFGYLYEWKHDTSSHTLEKELELLEVISNS